MRWHPEFTVAVGILLVFAPLYVGHLHVGDPTYRYEAAEVDPTDDGFEVRGEFPSWGLDDDIACVGVPDRQCVLERHLLADSNVSTIYGSVTLGHYRYDFVYADGAFYRVAYEERGNRTYLRLEQVPTETALSGSANPISSVRAPIRKAVESGSTTARRSLLGETGKLVRTSGTYYVVTEEVVRSSTAAQRRGEKIEAGLSLLGPAIGIVLVVWGQRRFTRGD